MHDITVGKHVHGGILGLQQTEVPEVGAWDVEL